ncbi:MAG: DUF2911 domain-containing protein [Bacteroidia bacterium]
MTLNLPKIMNKYFGYTLALALVLLVSPLMGQIRMPSASPSAKVEQQFGLSNIVIEYARPSAKGRTIFGDLVPYDKIWRTGANAATKITFGADVKLEGKDVPAGTYALYTIPGKESWSVMLYKDLSLGGNVAAYDKANELISVSVKPMAMPMKMETFTIGVDDLRDNSCSLYLIWEETLINLRVETDVDKVVMGNIERVLAGPSKNDYYQAAVYYYNADKDINQALTWINQALDDKSPYWMVTMKARIQTKAGQKKEAIATATQALELAKAANNADYVKINEDLIKANK